MSHPLRQKLSLSGMASVELHPWKESAISLLLPTPSSVHKSCSTRPTIQGKVTLLPSQNASERSLAETPPTRSNSGTAPVTIDGLYTTKWTNRPNPTGSPSNTPTKNHGNCAGETSAKTPPRSGRCSSKMPHTGEVNSLTPMTTITSL